MASGSGDNRESINADELLWIQLKDEIGGESLKSEETLKEKFNRKFSENPFVPIAGQLITEQSSADNRRPAIDLQLSHLSCPLQGTCPCRNELFSIKTSIWRIMLVWRC